jgi:dTDP-4-amino-4,6-dideoxygalactose transaminase
VQVPFVDLKAQYATITDQVGQAIQDVLRRAEFILGADVEQFEAEFAAYCNARYAAGVDSGLSALELALRAYKIGAGDEVIIPANTFIATALAVSSTGATPVLVDAHPATFNIDVGQLEAAVSPRTAAIIPVHLYGQPADMDPIMAIAERRGLVVIEDACQAHGARYKGRRVGSLGHAAAFSFYPGKNLGAYGDGGMLLSDDPGLIERVRMLRNYGQRVKYHHAVRGYNKRLDTLQAAILRVKLPYLDRWNDLRRTVAGLYRQGLADTGLALPAEAPYAASVWHLYVVRTAERDELQAHLTREQIACGVHYPRPVHMQEAYGDLGYRAGDFPVSEACAEQILSLPMYAELAAEQIAAVVQGVGAFTASRVEHTLLAASVGYGARPSATAKP